jgi:hypothetical protein
MKAGPPGSSGVGPHSGRIPEALLSLLYASELVQPGHRAAQPSREVIATARQRCQLAVRHSVRRASESLDRRVDLELERRLFENICYLVS